MTTSRLVELDDQNQDVGVLDDEADSQVDDLIEDVSIDGMCGVY